MNLYNLIKEEINKQILNVTISNNYVKLLRNWLNTLDFKGRSPKGMKKYHEKLNHLAGNLNNIVKYYKDDVESNPGSMHNIKAIFSYWKEKDIDIINDKFGNKKTIRELNLTNGIFFNHSIISEKRFKLLSNEINDLFDDLKGFHKTVLKPKLKIYFVKKNKSKATATYKSDKDVIYIRPDRIKAFGDDYASAKYIILHELGHRYEKYNKIPDNIYTPEFFTTVYSKTSNSWTGEQFAELFALSHWYNKYKEYKKQLDKFIKVMSSL